MISTLLKLSAAIFLPLVIWTVYLNQSRLPVPRFTTESDYIAGGVAIIFGLCAVASLKIARTSKVIAMVAYVPVAALALFVYGVGYVCSKFGSCL